MGEMDSNHKKYTVKLDSIPKMNIHKVPDRYFDELPGIIQARISKPSVREDLSWTLGMNWKLALVLSAFVVIVVFSVIFKGSFLDSPTADEILAEVPIEDLIEYLETTDITSDEILAELSLEDFNAEIMLEEDFELLDDNEIMELDDLQLYEEFGLEQENVF